MVDHDDGKVKRQLKRHYLIYYLRVFDRETGSVLGHLVDVNEKGIMVMRDSPLETGKNFSMRLRWRNTSGRLQVVDFNGVCRWSRPDVNPDFYACGFAITQIEEDAMKTISTLITDLGMPG